MKNQNPALEQGSPKPYGAHTHSLIWSINSKWMFSLVKRAEMGLFLSQGCQIGLNHWC